MSSNNPNPPKSQLQSQLNQAVQNLINSGVPSNTSLIQPNFLVEDIYPTMRPHFTDVAAKALHNRSPHLFHQYNEEVGHAGLAGLLSKLKIMSAQRAIDEGLVGWKRSGAICVYLGYTCERKDLDACLKKIIEAVNDLGSKKYIKASLVPLSIMKKHTAPYLEGSYIVFSYIHLTNDGVDYAKVNFSDLLFEEGGSPKDF